MKNVHLYRFGLLFTLLLLLWSLPMCRARADTTVNCTATMTDVSFGSVSFTDGSGSANSANPTATLNYTCAGTTASSSTKEYVTACFSIGDGVQGDGNFDPRQMEETTNSANILQFHLLQAATNTNWGSLSHIPPSYIAQFTVTRTKDSGGSYSGTASMRGTLVANQSSALPGSYIDQFTGNHTNIQVNASTSGYPSSCANGNSGNEFPFTVTATIVAGCTVTANDVDFGAVASTATNLSANSTLSIVCSNGTPYNVGLLPSNGSSTGAGTMKGTLTGNADQVPYQLRSTSGKSGTIWGNTASSSSTGNGVAGTGTGATQSLKVYATASKANYTPDDYTDTVTAYVNY